MPYLGLASGLVGGTVSSAPRLSQECYVRRVTEGAGGKYSGVDFVLT